MSVLLLAVLGCYANLKKTAPDLQRVRVQITISDGPSVKLGGYPGEYVAPDDDEIPGTGQRATSATADMSQTVHEVELEANLARRIDPQPLSENMTRGLLDTMQSGPPFALTTDPQVKDTLRIEVTSYGLAVRHQESPGLYTFDVKARLYRGDTGECVYSASLSCDTALGARSPAAPAFGGMDKMSDDELQAAFDGVAYYCGTYFAERMRRHAG